jgi:hypothetical protein
MILNQNPMEAAELDRLIKMFPLHRVYNSRALGFGYSSITSSKQKFLTVQNFNPRTSSNNIPTFTTRTIMSDSRLFKPLKVGSIELKHRVAMAPLTRYIYTSYHVV